MQASKQPNLHVLKSQKVLQTSKLIYLSIQIPLHEVKKQL